MELQDIYTVMRKIREHFKHNAFTKEVIEAFFAEFANGYDQKIISKYFEARGKCSNLQDCMSLLMLIFYHKRINLRIGFMIELNSFIKAIEHNRFFDLSELGQAGSKAHKGHNGSLRLCTKDFIEDDAKFQALLTFKSSAKIPKNFITKITTSRGGVDQFIDMNSEEFTFERKDKTASIIRINEEIISELNDELFKIEPFESTLCFKTNLTFEELRSKLCSGKFEDIEFEISSSNTNVDDNIISVIYDQIAGYLDCIFRMTTQTMITMLKMLLSNRIDGNIVISDFTKYDILRMLYTKVKNADTFIDVFSRAFWNSCQYILEYDFIRTKLYLDDMKYHFLKDYVQISTSFHGLAIKFKIYDAEIDKTVVQFVKNVEDYNAYMKIAKTQYFEVGVVPPQMLDMDHLMNARRNLRLGESLFKSDLKNNMMMNSYNTIRKTTNNLSYTATSKDIVSAPNVQNPSTRSNLDSIYSKNLAFHGANSDPGTIKNNLHHQKTTSFQDDRRTRFSLNSKESIVDRKFMFKQQSKDCIDWKAFLKTPWNMNMNSSGDAKSKLSSSEQFYLRAFAVDTINDKTNNYKLDNYGNYVYENSEPRLFDLEKIINAEDKNNGYSLSEKINEAVFVPLEADIIKGNQVESTKFSTSLFSKIGLVESLSFSQQIKEKGQKSSPTRRDKDEDPFNLMAVIEENPESANFNSYSNSKSRNSSKNNSERDVVNITHYEFDGINKGTKTLNAYNSMINMKEPVGSPHGDWNEIHEDIEKVKGRNSHFKKGRTSTSSNAGNVPFSQVFKPISQNILSEKLPTALELMNNLGARDKIQENDYIKSPISQNRPGEFDNDHAYLYAVDILREKPLDELLDRLIKNRATEKNRDLIQNALYLKRLKRKILGKPSESVHTILPRVLSFGNMDDNADFQQPSPDARNKSDSNTLTSGNYTSKGGVDENSLISEVRSDLNEYILNVIEQSRKITDTLIDPKIRSINSKKRTDNLLQTGNGSTAMIKFASKSFDQSNVYRNIILNSDMLKIIVGTFILRRNEGFIKSKNIRYPRRSLPGISKEHNIFVIYRKITGKNPPKISFSCLAKCVYGFIKAFKAVRIQKRKMLKSLALDQYNSPKHFPLDMSFARSKKYRFKILTKVILIIKKLYRHVQVNRVKRRYHGFLESPADKRKKLLKVKRDVVVKCVYRTMKLYRNVQYKRIKGLKTDHKVRRTKSFVKKKSLFVAKMRAIKVFLNLLLFVRRKASSKKTYRYGYTMINKHLKRWKTLIKCSSVLIKLFKHIQHNKTLKHKKGFLYLKCERFMSQFRKQWKYYKVFVKLFRFVKRKNKRGRIKLKFTQCTLTKIFTRIYSIVTFMRLLKFVRNKKINKRLGSFVEKRPDDELKRVSVFKRKLYCIKVLINLLNVVKKRRILKKPVPFCKALPHKRIRRTKYSLKSICHIVKNTLSLHRFVQRKRITNDNRYFLQKKYKGYYTYLNIDKIYISDFSRISKKYQKVQLSGKNRLINKWKRIVIGLMGFLSLYKQAKRSHLKFKTVSNYFDLLRKLNVKNSLLKHRLKSLVHAIMAVLKLYRVSSARRVTKRPKFYMNKRRIVKPATRFRVKVLFRVVMTFIKLLSFVKFKRITKVKTSFDSEHKRARLTLKKIKPAIKAVKVFLSLYAMLPKNNARPVKVSLKTLTTCILAFLKEFKLAKRNKSKSFIQRSKGMIKKITFRLPVKLKLRTLAIAVMSLLKLYKNSKYYTKIRTHRLMTLNSLPSTLGVKMSLKTIATAVMAFMKVRKISKENRRVFLTTGVRRPRYVLAKYKIVRFNKHRRLKLINRLRLLTKCIIAFLTIFKRIRVSNFKKLFSFGVNSTNNFKSTSKMLNSDNSLSPEHSMQFPELLNKQLVVKGQGSDNLNMVNAVKESELYNAPRSQQINSVNHQPDSTRKERNSNMKTIETTLSHIKKIIQPVSSKQNNIATQLAEGSNNLHKEKDRENVEKSIPVEQRTVSQSKKLSYEINTAIKFSKLKSVTKPSRSRSPHNFEIATVNLMAQFKDSSNRPKLYVIALSVMGFTKLFKYIQYKKEIFRHIPNHRNYSYAQLELMNQETRGKLLRKFKLVAKSILTFLSLYRFIKENSLLIIYDEQNNRDLSILNMLDNYVENPNVKNMQREHSNSYTPYSLGQPRVKVMSMNDTSSFSISRNATHSINNPPKDRSVSFERKRPATSEHNMYPGMTINGQRPNNLGRFLHNGESEIPYQHVNHAKSGHLVKEDGLTRYINNEDKNHSNGNYFNSARQERQMSVRSYQYPDNQSTHKAHSREYEMKRTMTYQPYYTELSSLSNYMRKN